MQYLVYDDMTFMTEADVQRLLPLVSPFRREQALRFKHLLGKWTTLKSYELLSELAGDIFTGSETWQYNEYGKPFVTDGPEFSLSHCHSGIAVAIDTHPIGIDIETIRPYNESLAARVMNKSEMAQIDASATLYEKALVFTRLWTQKEAVLKLRGTGIIDDLKNVLTGAEEVLTTIVNEEKNYVLTIAEL